MIPLRDTTRARSRPVANYVLIVLSVLVFLFQLSLPEAETQIFIMTFGLVPAELHGLLDGSLRVLPVLIPLFTSMFIHGGWMHLIGNMLFLHVFGDNVEDRLGHRTYLLFYLLCGVGATLTEVWIQGPSDTPLIGASGAIAGILGAYFVLYPRARVLTLIPLFFCFPVVELSAFFFLGFWFVMQFINGVVIGPAHGGGVAWWAHAGGFVFGILLLPPFLLLKKILR